MKLLGRIAMVMCGAALVGCGVEGSESEGVGSSESLSTQSSAIVCPQLVPPGPGFCENGTIVPVYEGTCIVAYRCI
ncbi:hypothetical protein F0U60_45685 [Archangium minus]|uniref:Lipoprotein n=1 Tax=Archangium minus TaxID=83450 RepID=A0ABY9X5I8_9BACT|nr:hypothetical protein F0U60_45685 [Archangium minus]